MTPDDAKDLNHRREELKTALQEEPATVGVRSRLGCILWEHSTQNLQLLCGLSSIVRGIWFFVPFWLPHNVDRAVFFFLSERTFGTLFILAGGLQMAVALFDQPRSRLVYVAAVLQEILTTYALVCFWLGSPWLLVVPGTIIFLVGELWIAAQALRERKP